MRSERLVLAVLVAALAAAACSGAGPSPTSGSTPIVGPTAVATATVTSEPTGQPTAAPSELPAICADPCAVGILEVAFHPTVRHIADGTEVTWTNRDPTTHTVTFSNGQIDSLDLPPGATFKHRFDDVGTFAYRCVIHAEMLASITVTP
jgi:plastocyanin